MKNTPSSVLMVRPTGFGYNPQTATTNAFQNNTELAGNLTIQNLALAEFDAMTKTLTDNGIDILVFDDTADPHTPDSIFPNNWISLHNETLILYPMLAENRQQERRRDIIDEIKKRFKVTKEIDLSPNEKKSIFLEGTGSLIFDYKNNYAFACISPRTDKKLTEDLCKQIGFTPIFFNAVDKNQMAIYHTNVMMCMAEAFSVICLESINNQKERKAVQETITKTGRELIEISLEQVEKFAGNMYELISKNGDHLLLMSEQAFKSLSTAQINAIRQYAQPLPIPLYTIEKNGGGSARCMIADIRLNIKQ